MSIKAGRIVRTSGAAYPYKVVLEHDTGESEHPVATMRQGETLIRSRLGSAIIAENKREGSFLLPGSRLPGQAWEKTPSWPRPLTRPADPAR